MAQRVIMDVDTGLDDAIALLIALCSPQIELLGITTVNGNCSVEICTENTLRLLGALGVDVPVYEGAAQPLVRPAQPDHGRYINLPPAHSNKQEDHAVTWLIQTLMTAPEAITLVPVGPLTNIATAIDREPRILPKIRELVIMGGGHAIANATPSAEFNIWIDPEAARLVLNCGRPIRLVPLDATHRAMSSREDVTRLERSGTRAGELAAILLDQYMENWDAVAIHDALAVCALIDPTVIRTQTIHVDVETRGELTDGRTVCDLRPYRSSLRNVQPPNVQFAVDADGEKFTQMLHTILGGEA